MGDGTSFFPVLLSTTENNSADISSWLVGQGKGTHSRRSSERSSSAFIPLIEALMEVEVLMLLRLLRLASFLALLRRFFAEEDA